MRSLYLPVFILLFSFINVKPSAAQTSGISSGAIYTIKLKSNNKLLDVSNASTENNAAIDCWANTGSDAQRWVVKLIGKNTFTLTNVASNKLLHLTAAPADSVDADQHENTNNNDIKWVITKAGDGSYYLKSSASTKFSLGSNGTDDGAKVGLQTASSSDVQKWIFQKEAAQAAAPTRAIADKIFDAWYNQYKIENGKGFWDKAEMMEIVLDAYEVTKDVKYKNCFNNMYVDFITKNKADWMYNDFNDDITWAVLFCTRGYLLTGNKAYLEKGKEQFDKMYARANTNAYGGGLNWFETKTSKNACINGPAMVACCYLARATGDKTYYDKAIAMYNWSKTYLFDPATGKVNDNVNMDKEGKVRVGTWSSTYNQGTYLGAAVMLYNYTKEPAYLADAEKIAQYTRNDMFKLGVINNEDGGNDLPGFKGIFARYARMYALEGHKTDLNNWLKLNAKTAYNNRNSQNLIHTKWATRTEETKPKSAFGSSTAVSLLFNTLYLQR